MEYIINYKCGYVVIKDNEIPFTLKNATSGPSTCDRIISVLNTITIPGHTIQLLDISLLDEAKLMGLSNILVEPVTAANILKRVLVAKNLTLFLMSIMLLFKS